MAHRYLDEMRDMALPLGAADDLEPILERIGDARYVLIGEASHGTHEYYAWRALLTRRLIEERGFSVVAVEGDWPDCYRVHRAVTSDALDPRAALERFERWPTWMWANEEVSDFLEWLRAYNDGQPPEARVGFYGLDVYSLWNSLQAILDYLRTHEPDSVDAALAAFRCFEPYAEDPLQYARAQRLVPESCEEPVVEMLTRMRERVSHDEDDPEARFAAEQNAEAAAGAERYYRSLVRGGAESWNVRDRHMVSTLERVMAHRGPAAKAVVWEHNTHLGDASATDMADAGIVNVGQLVRERHADDGVVALGFGSYQGTVLAADV